MAWSPNMKIKLASVSLVAASLVTATLLASQSQPPSEHVSNVPSPVLATVGNRTITLRDVEQAAALPLYQVEQQRDELLQRMLQRTIDNVLLEGEASRKGLTVSQLLTESSQSESITKMADMPAPVRRLAMAGSAEETNQDFAKDLQEEARIRQALLVSLRRKTDIRMSFTPHEPPVLPVNVDDDPSVGPTDAPVTIIEFSDFECPYCQKSAGVLDVLKRLYGKQIRIVYRDFPGPNHSEALPAAEAAECAHEFGKFWEYHDLLFARQTAGRGWDFIALAKEAGLQENTFSSCLTSGRHRQEILNDLRDAIQLGVTSTPTFFINGRPMVGAHTVSDFQAMIDPLLKTAARSDPPRS
ncbi:MAG TPA: thioredoxin domain-containing protein [Nitrospira sp.]